MISKKIIYDMVYQIPKGKVATYGQIARLIGYPRHARQIGRALSKLDSKSNVPWHRVVNVKGKISQRGIDGTDDYQKILLEDEGIVFNKQNTISLKIFQWQTE